MSSEKSLEDFVCFPVQVSPDHYRMVATSIDEYGDMDETVEIPFTFCKGHDIEILIEALRKGMVSDTKILSCDNKIIDNPFYNSCYGKGE